MNKRKLQEFATWAKLNLENQIELSLKQIGINSEYDVKRSKVQGDVTIIEGIEKTFNRQFNSERDQIINIVRTDGYKHTIEQFASTWFNRIIAIRFLEIHEYLDHGFKVFPNEPNTLPEILSNLNFVKEDL
ncbi:BREX-1 system adenine-specific DNA-methyltransferase PglX, partial [Patescibacteria group bacterium]|nr:BREX-1 system adenine-specific DNA-methyltransferase PglX [Patescibacteria group bacterium]